VLSSRKSPASRVLLPAHGEKVPKADEGSLRGFDSHPSPALRFAPCLPLPAADPAAAGRGTLDGESVIKTAQVLVELIQEER